MASTSKTLGDLSQSINNIQAQLNAINPTNALAAPAISEAVRDALSPLAGWIIFNTTTTKLQVYNGSSWVDLH